MRTWSTPRNGARPSHYGNAEADARQRAALADWCVRDTWFSRAAVDCKLMHCLPVRRNVAVADEVLDGRRSVVQREAYNRMVVQTAVLHRLLATPATLTTWLQRNVPAMIMHRPDPAAAIRSLRSAAPYIRMYKGKTFVVKAGGGVFADPAAVRGLIEQIAILHYFGVRVVFVHGGGPQLTEITEALGVPTRMVQGRRVTDQKAIDATSMVLNGLINTKLLAFCREMNIDAVGISGVDAGLIRAHKRAPVKLPTPARRWTTDSSATSIASTPRSSRSCSTTVSCR